MLTQSIYSTLITEAIEQAQFPVDPPKLYDPIRYILGLSGKRIRPLLVMLGADLFAFDDMESTIPAALAVEYFHNFSLIHDDIMDEAPLRRGAITVHKKWSENVAILSGDALLVKAYEEIAQCAPDKIPALLKVFNRMALEVCEGQQKDMDFETEDQVEESAYIAMIRAKTSVLLGGALQMGAILANANAEEQELLFQFGVNLGIAFQLQDDILDVYGNPENFGKQVGGDILCDKKTILRIHLQRLADEQDALTLKELVNERDAESKIQTTKQLYAKYDVRAIAEELKERYSEHAYKALEAIRVAAQQKVALLDLARNLMVRTH
ncbi:polyprenyl synthetase family protein [Sphingobacterium sp. lm-10]|uniref:polyprenyl synthetase family protein n=1 Tax=Sphingobacterium sp. lm-10 TaxID=2944904 RepID=UPI00201FE31B|nr:polyprenyl synthetase family protein [Sphingobacterium sp. lm-10]MCL7988891.1 polyprenyl synthetase family protein [Sphingobacterium sp. lm-10]